MTSRRGGLAAVLTALLIGCSQMDQFGEGLRVIGGQGGTVEQHDMLTPMAAIAEPLGRELLSTQPAARWQTQVKADAANLLELVAPERLLLGQLQLSNLLASPELGPLTLFDTNSGQALWTYQASPMPAGRWTLLHRGATLVLASSNGRSTLFHALNRNDGTLRWTHTIDSPSSLVVDESHGAFIVDGGGKLGINCIDLTSGQVLWTRPSEKQSDASPSKLLIVGEKLISIGAQLTQLDLRSGGQKWQTAIDKKPGTQPMVLPVNDGLLIAGQEGLRLLDTRNGHLIWGPLPLKGSVTSLVKGGSDKGQIYATARQDNTVRIGNRDFNISDDTLHAISLKDGKEQWHYSAKSEGSQAWRREVAGIIGGAPLLVGSTVWISTDAKLLRLASKDGRLLSETPLAPPSWLVIPPWSAPDLLVLRGSRVLLSRDTAAFAVIGAFNANDGQKSWVQSTQGQLRDGHIQLAAPYPLILSIRMAQETLGGLADFDRRMAAWWRAQLTISGNYDTASIRQPGSQNLGAGFQLAQAIGSFGHALSITMAANAQAALSQRKQIDLEYVLSQRQRALEGRYWVRGDETRGNSATIVDLDTGLRKDLVHSTFNPGMRNFGFVMPSLLTNPEASVLFSFGAGLDTSRFERYVKFRYGMPYPFLIRHDLGGMPWRELALDNYDLVSAAQTGDIAKAADLIKRGASLRSAPSPSGTTALIAASEKGMAEMVDWLLAQGADPNYKPTLRKWTAIESASYSGHPQVVTRLLKAGALPGRSMELAIMNKKDSVIDLLKASTKQQ